MTVARAGERPRARKCEETKRLETEDVCVARVQLATDACQRTQLDTVAVAAVTATATVTVTETEKKSDSDTEWVLVLECVWDR